MPINKLEQFLSLIKMIQFKIFFAELVNLFVSIVDHARMLLRNGFVRGGFW